MPSNKPTFYLWLAVTAVLLVGNSSLITYLLTRQPEKILSCVFKDNQGMPQGDEQVAKLTAVIAALEAEVAAAKERAAKPCCVPAEPAK